MVTGGSFPAAIWTGFMKGALKKTDVQNFPKPPKDKLRGLDCPTILSPDMEKAPLGCPTPEVLEDPFLDEANPEDGVEGELGEPGDAPAPGEAPGEQPAGEQGGNSDETVSAAGPRSDNRDNGRDGERSGKKKNND
jgi:membrane peptidoglycan carboxypeptidase